MPEEVRSSGVKGVHWHQKDQAWRVTWLIIGKRHFKLFSERNHGTEGSLKGAIAFKRESMTYTTKDPFLGKRWRMDRKSWTVKFSNHGDRIYREFAVSKLGEEDALKEAVSFYNKHRPTESKPKPKKPLKSRTQEVKWRRRDEIWCAAWVADGVRKEKGFPARKFGHEKALQLAIEFRKNMCPSI